MPSDNEVMVLIYETVQKQLNQIKDTRVVIQSLSNKTAELEQTINEMNAQTTDIAERLSALEMTVAEIGEKTDIGLENVRSSDTKLKDTVNAMRVTLDNVTNPSISLVSKNHSEVKEAVRELKNVHGRVMDEFEQYELRLVKLEDNIEKMLKKQLLTAAEEKSENDE